MSERALRTILYGERFVGDVGDVDEGEDESGRV